MAEDGPSSAERGRWAEDLACKHLIDHGLVLVTRNYRCRYGEIDLIMRDGRTIAFVEVRLRSRIDYGTGAESVDTCLQILKSTSDASDHRIGADRDGRDYDDVRYRRLLHGFAAAS